MATIYWVRNDLRLHDNEIWSRVKAGEPVVPVYILDPRFISDSQWGHKRLGWGRARFLSECLHNLRTKLEALGGALLVRSGAPEQILPQLAQEFGATRLLAQREWTWDETQIEEALETQLAQQKVAVEWVDGLTLVHPDDLPFPIRHLPDIFTQFRKAVERESPIRKLFPSPKAITVPEGLSSDPIPSAEDLVGEKPEDSFTESLPFAGGEEAALERVKTWMWNQDLLKTYKETRNGLLGLDFSSHFSPWLAVGAVSPRYLYWEVKRYESERLANESTYWLIFELYWRDYFKFVAWKYGKALFLPGGLRRQKPESLRQHLPTLERWRLGQTGVPFVDANMRELLATGFMSNRGRQNVASFLVKDLGQDWRWGAAWFEHQLVDYDPASNWGNWAYVAGVGNDPRENRYFNIARQAEMYDPQAQFVKHWCPELEGLPASRINHSETWTKPELQAADINLGVDYPNRIGTRKVSSQKV